MFWTESAGMYSRFEPGKGQVFGVPAAFDCFQRGDQLYQVQPNENNGFENVLIRKLPLQERYIGALPSPMRARSLRTMAIVQAIDVSM